VGTWFDSPSDGRAYCSRHNRSSDAVIIFASVSYTTIGKAKRTGMARLVLLWRQLWWWCRAGARLDWPLECEVMVNEHDDLHAGTAEIDHRGIHGSAPVINLIQITAKARKSGTFCILAA
jgi:hypothetical protein